MLINEVNIFKKLKTLSIFTLIALNYELIIKYVNIAIINLLGMILIMFDGV